MLSHSWSVCYYSILLLYQVQCSLNWYFSHCHCPSSIIAIVAIMIIFRMHNDHPWSITTPCHEQPPICGCLQSHPYRFWDFECAIFFSAFWDHFGDIYIYLYYIKPSGLFMWIPLKFIMQWIPMTPAALASCPGAPWSFWRLDSAGPMSWVRCAPSSATWTKKRRRRRTGRGVWCSGRFRWVFPWGKSTRHSWENDGIMMGEW